MHKTKAYLHSSLFGGCKHYEIFSRRKLPSALLQPIMDANGYRFHLWLTTRDFEYMQNCPSFQRECGYIKLVKDTPSPLQVGSRSYINLSQFQDSKALLGFAKKAVHINLTGGKRFSLPAQVLLIGHSNKHNLFSRFWVTQDLLREMFDNTISLKKDAVPVEVPICDLESKTTDVGAKSIAERLKQGVVLFYNAEQTNDSEAIHERCQRGFMRFICTGQVARPKLQHYLHLRAKKLDFRSNYWISKKQLLGDYPGLYPKDGARPLSIHTRKTGAKTSVYNLDQLEKGKQYDRLLRRACAKGYCFSDKDYGFARNIFGGYYKIPAIANELRAFANARGFTCPYWADEFQLPMVRNMLAVKPGEEGVVIESKHPKGRRTLYNLEQMENYRTAHTFVEKLTPSEVNHIITNYHDNDAKDGKSEEKVEEDDLGFGF